MPLRLRRLGLGWLWPAVRPVGRPPHPPLRARTLGKPPPTPTAQAFSPRTRSCALFLKNRTVHTWLDLHPRENTAVATIPSRFTAIAPSGQKPRGNPEAFAADPVCLIAIIAFDVEDNVFEGPKAPRNDGGVPIRPDPGTPTSPSPLPFAQPNRDMRIRSGRRKVDSRARAATLAAPASGGEIFANAGDYAHLKSGSTLSATINTFGTGQRWPTRAGTEPGQIVQRLLMSRR